VGRSEGSAAEPASESNEPRVVTTGKHLTLGQLSDILYVSSAFLDLLLQALRDPTKMLVSTGDVLSTGAVTATQPRQDAAIGI
jgi:hypothetical protein